MTQPDDAAYRSAFHQMSTPALLTDTEFVITDMNEAGLAFVGYDREQVVGEHVSLVAADGHVIEAIVETLLEDEGWRGEFPLLTDAGEEVIGRGSASPYRVDGEIEGYVAVFIDVTDTYRYERTTRVLNRLLRHDLRNEINVAVATLETAMAAIDDPEAVTAIDDTLETLTDVVEKSQRARDLQEILERDFTGRAHLQRLDEVLQDAIEEVTDDHEPGTFSVGEFPSVSIVGDDLLPTVFSVVLDNAVVHNDAADPRVEVQVDHVDEESVVVAVSDNGPGIPDGAEDLVFGREERTPVHHGSGISLFFADAAVDSYGGSVWITDDEPGTTVKIELPRPE